MEKTIQSQSQLRNSRYTDISDEPVTRLLSPIKGYEAVPLVPLEQALSSVSKFFDGIKDYIYVAKENCKHPTDGLNQDEAASIHLYTMQFDVDPSLYKILNTVLRSEDRDTLKPWFPFLKLFLTALYKLPSCTQTVWRGVRGVDLNFKYPTGMKFVWWGVSSCTLSVDILKSDAFLGTQGIRTLFSIDCKAGKPIGSHSYFNNQEQEVIIMPGSYFEVMGQLNPAVGLLIIQLKQIDPPIVFVKPPFTNLPLTSNLMNSMHSGDTTHSSMYQSGNALSMKMKPPAAMPSLPLLRRKLGLIILGNSGVGKSFLANVLLGQEAFVHLAAPRAVTTQTEFKELDMGNETFAIFNIPGLVEADQKRIEMNKVEIGKAFSERPMSLILYVFGSQGGRIRDEDVVAFNALNKAYPFNLKSLVLIVNGLPKDRPKNYEGEVIVLLEELIKLPCRNLCVLDTIDKNNQDEKQKLKNKLFQVIVERRPQDHQKKQDIELQSEDVRNAKEEIKALQKAFQKNKEMYEEKIQGQQTLYDQMFATIRNENENMRRLVERQTEEARELKNRMLEQEAAYKKIQEQRDAEYREAMHQMQEAHKKVIEEAQRASHLNQLSKDKNQNINLTPVNQERSAPNVGTNAPQNSNMPLVQSPPTAYASLPIPQPIPKPIPQPNILDYIFVNGPWRKLYYHNGAWHGPFTHFMSFNPYNNTIDGYGVDDVGEFVLSGYYTRNTLHIAIVQSYKLGTGDPSRNSGHRVQSPMTWNHGKHTFQGDIGIVEGQLPIMPEGIVEMWPAHITRA